MSEASARILDGKWLAASVQAAIKRGVEQLAPRVGRRPGLGVILIGDNPASQTYVANKEKTAVDKCGFKTFNIALPKDASFEQAAEAIARLNAAPDIDGILLQLPLPKHLDGNALLDLIDPLKDADGLHPLNQGKLLRGDGGLLPCTPLGALHLLDLAGAEIDTKVVQPETRGELPRVDLAGQTAIVIGRSILVGKPAVTLLLQRNATVIQAHSKTKNLAALCATADVVIAAVGVPEMVRGDWIKPGAVVIDVGINRLPNGKLIGDVAFTEAAARAAALTPVPGGVGPMTIAMLMRNTFTIYRQRTSSLGEE